MMGEINRGLQGYIQQAILPLYQGFDQAHDLEHVRHVIENSLELVPVARELYGDVDADMVYTVAAYHDTGLQAGRENHGVTSGRYLMADQNLRQWFTPGQLEAMRDAVEDHRASSGHEPRSVYGRIISEADRDIDPERIVRRVIEYGYARYLDLNDEERVEGAIAHMKNKYGEGGYMHRYLPCKRNEEGLARLRRMLETGQAAAVCRKYIR